MKDAELLEVSRLSSLQNTQSPQHCPRPTLSYHNLAPAQVLVFENEKKAISVPCRWCITVPRASPGQHPASDLKRTDFWQLQMHWLWWAPDEWVWLRPRMLWLPPESWNSWEGDPGFRRINRELTELTGKENSSIPTLGFPTCGFAGLTEDINC